MTTAAVSNGAPTIGAMVDGERRHVRRAELAAAALSAAGLTALSLGTGAALLGRARWLDLPRAVPLLVWLMLGAVLLALGWSSRRRIRHRAARANVALAIESEQGLRRGLLVGAIELEGQGALAARAGAAARSALPAGTRLAPAWRRDSRRRALHAGALAMAGAVVLGTATPLFGNDGLQAVLRPIDAWRGTLLEPLRIGEAPRELLRGSPLRITVRADGRRRIFLAIRQTGESWRTDTVAVGAGGAASWALDAIHGDVMVVASDGRTSSDTAVVHAADRPFVGAVRLQVLYPAYLARAPESLPVGEPLHLPRGTLLTMSGRASVPLASVRLVGAGDDGIAFSVGEQRFDGRMTVTHSTRFRWVAMGRAGPVADVPPPLDIEAIADSAPRVSIAEPQADTILATEDQASLSVVVSDDHGIASVSLRALRVRAGGEALPSITAVTGAVGTNWSGPVSLDIAALALQPGELARVRVEAVDDSPWSQRGVSRELIVKRPTMEERREVARTVGDAAVRDARAAAAAQKSLAQRTDEAARAQARAAASRNGESASSDASSSAAPPKSMSFESAEKARALAQEQRAMTDRVQKLRDATRQLQQQLAAAGALDTALARQLGEAQAMLRQALTPQMLSQMEKLERAASQMNGEQSRDALRDLAQMQQRMKEQLERSAEMLSRAAHEGAMQTLGDQARELAQAQQALADSAASPTARSGEDARAQARESATLAERARRLRQQMDDLRSRLAKDKADAGASRTERAGEHAAASETGMRRAATALGQKGAGQKDAGQPSPEAVSRANEGAAEMQKAAESIREARAAQVKEWKKELTSELDQAVQELLQLSREERALEQKARSGGGAAGDDQRGAQSAVEQGVSKTNDRLQGAGKKSALLSPRSQRAVGEAKDKVSQATQKVAQSGGSPSQQASALGDAADALTRAAAALARDRERANGAGSASGFSEMLQQMQEMAKRQGEINGQAQGLMGMPGGATGAQGQALSRALAQKQRGVADQLEDIGDGAGGGRAAQLARDARQLAEQLDGGRLDAGTLARQQQLFRRLLDAGRSLEKEEREDTGKREARTATGTDAFAPAGRVDARAASRFRSPTWDELRGLSAEERRAILDYFTRLNHAPPR